MNTRTISSRTILYILSVVLVPVLLLLSPMRGNAADVELTADFSAKNKKGDLEMFWNGSGVNRQTADYTSKVMRQNMLLIGSIPHQGSLYQRPHDLLELVKVSGMESDNPQYDWSKLDKFLNIIVKSGQKLYFELMGNPEGYHFVDPEKDNKWTSDNQARWTRFIEDLVLHLEKRFGKDEVRSWYFQTWNEPTRNIPPYEQFKLYYEASLRGLANADKGLLRFGGPAVGKLINTKGRVSKYAINFINWTKNKNKQLDYISYHVKGLPKAQVGDEIKAIDLWKDLNKPFFNEEADSESGWWKNREVFKHRATPWYAAFIARNVDEHLTKIINKKGIEYRLHNDNAFLNVRDPELLKEKGHFPNGKAPVGAWKQRTHFAHFGDDDNKFALLKKPAHNVMTMLSLLGDKQYKVTPETSNGIWTIATKRGENQVAILIYRYNDDFEMKKDPIEISLKLESLPFQTGKIAHYRLDQDHSNTYQKWIDMGKPVKPTDGQLQTLRDIQELGLLKSDSVSDLKDLESNTLSFSLRLPGVSLILISGKPDQCPAQITEVYTEPFPSLNSTNGEDNEVLIKWDSGSRFIQSYDVYYSDSEEGPFSEKVNTVDLISTAYIHRPVQVPAYYKVVARDYWGRTHESDGCCTADGFKIDLGADGQDVQCGWTGWSASGDDVTVCKSFDVKFDANFMVCLGNVDWRIRKQVNNPLGDLIEDAVKNSSPFMVTFEDLDAGTYQITTYHHDSNEADGTLDINLTDADGTSKAVDDLPQSGGTNPNRIAKATFEFRSDGRDVVLQIADNNDGGFNEAFLNGIELQSKPDGDGVNVEIEAETYASAVGDWTDGSDTNASGGIFMVVPKGTGNDRQCTGLASGTEHYMEYSFMAPGDGTHYIWVRGFGNGGGHDSVCVSVDDGSLRRLDTAVNTWGWTTLSGFDFTRNSTHNLKIHLREDNTYADKILITADAQFAPTK